MTDRDTGLQRETFGWAPPTNEWGVIQARRWAMPTLHELRLGNDVPHNTTADVCQ